MVIPLREVASNGANSFIEDAISKFTCQDKDVETFLKEKAFDFERRDKSRTYLVMDDSSGILLGYFTLSLNALPFRDSVSKNTIKRIDGFSKDVNAVGIVLIGQLGKDSEKAKGLSGIQLLNMCIEAVCKVQEIIGGRFVMLECQDITKVVEFYKKNGFQFLQFDEKDKYLQMVRRL